MINWIECVRWNWLWINADAIFKRIASNSARPIHTSPAINYSMNVWSIYFFFWLKEKRKLFINNFFREKWWILRHTRVYVFMFIRCDAIFAQSLVDYLYKCMFFTMNSNVPHNSSGCGSSSIFIFARSSACIPDFITICGKFYRFTRIMCKHMSRVP